MDNFIAIDFETANQYPSSVCSVGLVFVRDGAIVDEKYNLIKPYPNFYLSRNTAIHGLSSIDTQEALPFDEVWEKLAPHIGSMPLVAHNAPFDRRCLIAAHKAYDLYYPDYEFLCTLKASRKVFRELPDHKLHTVSAQCGFILENHHNALADAEACAYIAMKIL